MNLLITGATGFVGFNLLLDAHRSGNYDKIFTCVRNGSKLDSQLDAAGLPRDRVVKLPWGAPVESADPIDHAVHCAGILFARDRDSYFSVNVAESMRVLSSLPPATRLLVLSSQSAGGPTPAGQPFRRMTDRDAPLTWYGESKLALESAIVATRQDALILRPPMILGPRDTATIPLFKLAAGWVRPKPGIHPKWFSWIAVSDLVRDILSLLATPDWNGLNPRILYAAAPEPISDEDLVATAARVVRAKGVDLPLPHPVLRAAAWIVDTIPALREANPSLTRDRVKEIFSDRWVIDASGYRALAGSPRYDSLTNTLAATHAWNRDAGRSEDLA